MRSYMHSCSRPPVSDSTINVSCASRYQVPGRDGRRVRERRTRGTVVRTFVTHSNTAVTRARTLQWDASEYGFKLLTHLGRQTEREQAPSRHAHERGTHDTRAGCICLWSIPHLGPNTLTNTHNGPGEGPQRDGDISSGSHLQKDFVRRLL